MRSSFQNGDALMWHLLFKLRCHQLRILKKAFSDVVAKINIAEATTTTAKKLTCQLSVSLLIAVGQTDIRIRGKLHQFCITLALQIQQLFHQMGHDWRRVPVYG